MSGSDSTHDGPRPEPQSPPHQEHDVGHTGEGAASAMAHMISEGQRQGRHRPEQEAHAGSRQP